MNLFTYLMGKKGHDFCIGDLPSYLMGKKINLFNFDTLVNKSNNVEIITQTDRTLVAEVTEAATWQTAQYSISNLEKNTDYVFKFDFENTSTSDTYKHTYMTVKNSSGTNLFNNTYNHGDKIIINTGNSTTLRFYFHVTMGGTATTNKLSVINCKLKRLYV